jgi:ribosomal protein S20
MIKKKTLLQILVIYIAVIAVSTFMPNTSQAAISSTGYDFEEVEIGSSETTMVTITNLADTDAVITGIVFANTTCSDFSIPHTPDNLTIPAKGIIEVEIGYTPSSIGTCSDTLRIYNGTPFPNMVTFVGTGIEPVVTKLDLFYARKQSLDQIAQIKSFVNESLANESLKGTGKGKRMANKREKSFYKMLVIATHMIENGNIEAAHNKLNSIYKKIDGKPNPEDFVTGNAAGDLAAQVQNLILSLNSI